MGVLWKGDNDGTLAMISTSSAATVDSFSVRVAKHNNTALVTTATNESVPVEINGTITISIGCSGDLGNTYETLYINIAGTQQKILFKTALKRLPQFWKSIV